jgi:hypothetical protein
LAKLKNLGLGFVLLLLSIRKLRPSSTKGFANFTESHSWVRGDDLGTLSLGTKTKHVNFWKTLKS